MQMKLSHVVFAVFLCGVAVGCAAGPSSETQIYSYEPAMIELNGTLTTKQIFGPPNYGETPEKDARETVYILKLDTPIAVRRDPNSELNLESFSNIVAIQVALRPGVNLKRELINGHVTVTGSLFQGVTGHHVTNVVLNATSVVAE